MTFVIEWKVQKPPDKLTTMTKHAYVVVAGYSTHIMENISNNHKKALSRYSSNLP